MVLTRSPPEGGSLGGANAQGEHFVSTDPRAILPSLCFNRVSLSEEMVSSGGKALDCGLGATLDLGRSHLLRRLDRGCNNTPFSRLYTLVTRQRGVRHRRADPLRRAGVKAASLRSPHNLQW